MAHTDKSEKLPSQLGTRKKIGIVTSESESSQKNLEGLTPAQHALREAAINHFKANKVKAFITKQIRYVNSNRQVADGIRFLFDEHGNPPVNAPLEDIISERKKIESEIRWFEAMTSELRNKLVQIREIEELSIDLMNRKQEE